ncbi:hypothetical protein [Streptomyces sp. NPDC059970]|uniref:hypothetical protein n=1 Tax=Streptomyces sp. NPDC059970 TaxID=3347019 RepID=UPI003698DD2C
MFTVEQRRLVRAQLIDRARSDPRIVGAALTGSGARDTEDSWSDIDLFFGVTPGNELSATLEDWSAYVYQEFGAIHHFDLQGGPAVYRAFLLGELLEIDLGFVPSSAFGPRGDGAFKVLFGNPAPRQSSPLDTEHLIGRSWHHVLHARTCIERGALWQAEYWISALRDHTLTLACHRLGASVEYAKGADHLPVSVTGPLREALVRTLEAGELRRALKVATQALLVELRTPSNSASTSLETALIALAEG